MNRSLRRSFGQALVEGMLTMLLLVLVSAAVTQALWLFAMQQLSQAATIYAAKQGAREHLDTLQMRLTYGYRMRGIPGVNPLWIAIERLYPDDALLAKMSAKDKHGNRVLTTNFHGPRMQGLSQSAQQDYLDARIFTVAVRLCVDLKVPLVAQLMSAAQAKTRGMRPCGWLGYRLNAPFEIYTTATVPIESVVQID